MVVLDEVRLPDYIERGAKGGPGFNTTVFELNSGFEKRNQNWAKARLKWDIGCGVMYLEDDVGVAALKDIMDFFYARAGKAYGFRFKDRSDYQIFEQSIGTGTGSNPTFQVFKRYSSGGRDYDRVVKKLVSGSVLV